MNCQSCLTLLQDRLDGLTVDHVIEEHLRGCPECRAIHASATRLQEGLRRLPPPTPPRDLAPAIVASVLTDARARRRRRFVAALAVAAAVLLAVGISLLWPVTTQAPVDPQPPAPLAQGPGERVPDANLRQSVAEVGSAVVSLTNRTAEETVEQARVLLPVVTGPGLDELLMDQTFDAPALPFNEAGQAISASLEPVTSSAVRAVGLFLRDLPPVEAQAKPGL